MKIQTPKLKSRLARLPSAKSNRTGKVGIKALAKISPFKKAKETEAWMPLGRWDPSSELNRFQRDLDRLWSRWLSWSTAGKEPMTVAAWSPRVDISEDDQEYVVKAELPGVSKDGMRVTVEDCSLSIRGERQAEREEKGKKFHRKEWSYGSFERRFALPPGTDASRITSELKDGLLRVHVPKSHEARSKSTEIQIP